MLVGYMRVSSDGDRQVMDLQRDALLGVGIDERHLFEDRASGSRDDRAGLAKALAFVHPGDCLVVWKLDRLGRSLKELVALVTGFQEKGIHFVSLQDHLDTTTAQGRLMFNLFASLAEFERDIIRERTKAGLTAARARGRQGGRPKGLSKEALSKAQAAKTLYLQQDKTVAEIGQLLGVGRATIYRYLAHLGVPTGSTPKPVGA